MYSWESAIPHRTIARAGFRRNNLSSCASCASCASMLIIRLVATRAVEAAPSRFVALRVLLISHLRNAAFAPLRLDRLTPPLRGTRRSRAVRRRLMRWGGGSPGRQAGVPVSRRAAAAQNRVRRPGAGQWICFTIPPEGAMVAPRIRFGPVPIHVLNPHALKTGPTRH